MPFEGSELSLGRKLAFFALTMSAGGYIAAMFSAVGVSVNFQVNGNALPSSVSQFHCERMTTMSQLPRLATYRCLSLIHRLGPSHDDEGSDLSFR